MLWYLYEEEVTFTVSIIFYENVLIIRFRCHTSANSSAVAVSDVRVPIDRAGSIQTAVLPNGFRYAVRYNVRSSACIIVNYQT